MSDRREPASPRRRALATQAGVIPHSTTLTSAASWAAALAVLLASGPRLVEQLGIALRAALASDRAPSLRQLFDHTLDHTLAHAIATVVAVMMPALIAMAAATLVVHVAQTRKLWMPVRQVRGAPTAPRGARARASGALWATVRGIALAGVGAGWLIAALPTLAVSLEVADLALWSAAPALLASAALWLVVTWCGLGVLELLGRSWILAQAAQMTKAEVREEARSAGGAVRAWSTTRRRTDAHPQRTDLGDTTIIVVGDELAVAVAWDRVRRPSPAVTAVRRGREVGALLALARRDSVPIRRQPELAQRLAGSAGAAVPRTEWAALAAVVAHAGEPGPIR